MSTLLPFIFSRLASLMSLIKVYVTDELYIWEILIEKRSGFKSK